ncbi:hypothetical protein Ga0074812_15213 [Parafrankia irregularis]|uniref:Uncharacterized protein n=1 Tax=Parafrankia irregularis TaxID=795642 RepID=A0A0S4R1A6_9ACTN|nr:MULTISPECIES: hypothetical protein [Parafrankia]CUU60988.1 hypothetical protein Ga0074812_15213 [Parafrankia irregularis]
MTTSSNTPLAAPTAEAVLAFQRRVAAFAGTGVTSTALVAYHR